MKELLLGKLDWSALPHAWFTIGASITYIGMVIIAVLVISRLKRWKWLWNEWLTSVDPKKIGIMYFIAGGFMLVRGGLDAIMLWLQQALGSSNMPGLTGETVHGY